MNTIISILKEVKDTGLSAIFRLSGMKPWKTGYFQYRQRYIKRMIAAGNFNPRELKKNYGLRCDERVVEYPWLFSLLPSGPARMLDAGSIMNYDIVVNHPEIAVKDLSIMTLSPEIQAFWQKKISYHFGDLRELPFKDDWFDLVVSLSTIEHIGFDNTKLYCDDQSKNENDKSSWKKAIKEYRRTLKPGGKLFVSFPFGKNLNYDWFQIFDSAMVNELIETFNPAKIDEYCYKYEKSGWRLAERNECSEADYFDIWKSKEYGEDFAAASRAICCLVLTK